MIGSIGLAGSHRTGKTTLARIYAERYELPFVETNVSDAFKSMGYDPKEDYDFTTRLYIQGMLLDHMDTVFDDAPDVFIADRTPIDLMLYTMSEVTRYTVDVTLSDAYKRYIRHCYEMANDYFSMMVLVQPGIRIVEDEGKAPANEAYMEHLNALTKGLLLDSRLEAKVLALPASMTDIADRVSAVRSAAKKTIEMALSGAGIVSH